MEKFIEEMVDILDSEEEITMETVLEDLDEWDSLSIVSFLALANTMYGKKISSAEVKEAKTIQDLYLMLQ